MLNNVDQDEIESHIILRERIGMMYSKRCAI